MALLPVRASTRGWAHRRQAAHVAAPFAGSSSHWRWRLSAPLCRQQQPEALAGDRLFSTFLWVGFGCRDERGGDQPNILYTIYNEDPYLSRHDRTANLIYVLRSLWYQSERSQPRVPPP
jgi:hypothetical protein